MKKYFLIATIFAALCGGYSNGFAGARAGVGIVVEEPVPDYYYYNYPAWTGPGYYFGIWFGDEMAFHSWYRGHYRHHHHRHGGGGHHHGGGGHHHGGGGHHHGGRHR